MQRILLQLCFVAVLLLLTCEKTTTQPPPPAGPDTTSHEFVWRIDTLGEGPQYSSLWDVAIIDENDIWVVGDIRMKDTYQQDSLGNTIQPYNAAHWDGQEWELVRIPIKLWNTNTFIISELRIINRFENGDLWVSNGGEVIKYKNGEWGGWEFLFDNLSDTTKGSVKEIWGNSTNSVYAVDSKGNVQFYNGLSWQRLPRIVTTSISDIWGQVNQSGSPVLYATVAKETFHPDDPDSKILKITGTEVREVSSEGLPRRLSGIWFDEKAGYFVVGTRIFYTRTLDENSQWIVIEPDITSSYLRDIVAGDTNDIFIVGDFGTVIHYNGSTWKNLSDTQLPAIQAVLKTLEIVGDLVVITGTLTSSAPPRGIILTGKRIKN